jgi:hypothetical protein
MSWQVIERVFFRNAENGFLAVCCSCQNYGDQPWAQLTQEGSRPLPNTESGVGARSKGAGGIQLASKCNYLRLTKSAHDIGIIESAEMWLSPKLLRRIGSHGMKNT